jgi:hypothetical protein
MEGSIRNCVFLPDPFIMFVDCGGTWLKGKDEERRRKGKGILIPLLLLHAPVLQLCDHMDVGVRVTVSKRYRRSHSCEVSTAK